MRRQSQANFLTVLGIAAICGGLLVPFMEVYPLFNAFIPIIGIGVVLAFIGSVMRSRQMARSRRRVASAILLALGVGLFCVAGSNVHVWGLFFLIAIPAILLGLVILIMGIFIAEPPTSL